MHKLTIRNVRADEGAAVHRLITQCPPLDVNSAYAYYLLTHHHSSTCYVAVNDADKIVAAVTAYLLPEQPQTLFVWQIAVHAEARGQGIASKLLQTVLESCSGITTLQTTISPSNTASIASFKRLAERQNASFAVSAFLAADACGAGHEAEDLITITLPT